MSAEQTRSDASHTRDKEFGTVHTNLKIHPYWLANPFFSRHRQRIFPVDTSEMSLFVHLGTLCLLRPLNYSFIKLNSSCLVSARSQCLHLQGEESNTEVCYVTTAV